MALFRKLLLLALLQLLYNQSSAQGRLVSVVRQQTLTLTQQVDSVIAEFGLDIRKQDLSRAVSLLKYVGRDVHCVALSYRTQDPSGREVIASGLFSYPEKGPFRGAVEMLPYSRQKSMCGSARLYSPEAMISVLGYVVLVPDTIGYGASGDLDIAYHLCDNIALVAAHFREAVQEYLSTVLGRKLPRKTTLFGYSLGASGALALAYYYAEHPQCDVKVQALCLGGGAYNPAIALDYSINRGEMNYLLYPACAASASCISAALRERIMRLRCVLSWIWPCFCCKDSRCPAGKNSGPKPPWTDASAGFQILRKLPIFVRYYTFNYKKQDGKNHIDRRPSYRQTSSGALCGFSSQPRAAAERG